MIIKRFLAYLIDIVIVLLVYLLLVNILPKQNINELNHLINSYSDSVLNKTMNIDVYVNNVININYEIQKTEVLNTILNFIIIIIYFIIVPIFTKGKTIGLHIFKLKIGGKLNFINLFIRNIFTTGLVHMILSFILLYILNYKMYFISTTILSFIQVLLVIISTIMIIYRSDKKGLQDILSNTYIEEVK